MSAERDPALGHYDRLLGRIYAWMVGPFDEAVEKQRVLLESLGLGQVDGLAVDLGSGHGVQSIALVRLGARVLALDGCGPLLEQLRANAGDAPVRTVEDDLRSFRAHLDAPAKIIVCMGDTLTHLPEAADVRKLIGDAAAALVPGGSLVLTFRDYSAALEGTARFIPVKSSEARILTCFLEYGPTHVTVHDLLHERRGDTFELSVSAYRKLRLPPDEVVSFAEGVGLRLTHRRLERGLVVLAFEQPD